MYKRQVWNKDTRCENCISAKAYARKTILNKDVYKRQVLNIAVVTNTIPNTGISLPFFSSGGTSLMMLLGCLLYTS